MGTALDGVNGNGEAPTVLNARGKEVLHISFELVQAVDRCDQLLRKHGMQMVILCEHCNRHGHPHPNVSGDNQRFGSSFTMTCAHAERRYDFGS